MKILLTIAATLAAFNSVSDASANTSATGHYEWQNRAQPGPNKSNLPSCVRVWGKDSSMVANCDCAMMKDKTIAAACMDMPNNGASHSKG
jgi:predicted ribosomally synthesized peptide with SipW-like signal peptide